MKSKFAWIVLTGMLIHPAHAARIFLANTESGGNTLTIPEFGTGQLDIRIEMAAVDTIKIAFLSAFLDSDDDNLQVTAVSHGQNYPWVYDDSNYFLPAALSEDLGNEYMLICGDKSNGGGLPTGDGTFVMDTLTLENLSGQSGEKHVTFEAGSRQPTAIGPKPFFEPYITAPVGFPTGFPNFLYIGDDTSTNPAFVITKAVPEPATLGLLALGALVAIRRR